MTADTMVGRVAAAERRRTKVGHMVATVRRAAEQLGHPPLSLGEVAAMLMQRDAKGRLLWEAVAVDCPLCAGHRSPSARTMTMVLEAFPEEI
jgi:hypothetical protein